jgi:uncharacterized protein (TIGR03437 family)
MIASIAALPARAINLTEYVAPTPNSGLNLITAGPDGALWFTESAGNKIGRITPNGAITEFPLPKADSNPGSIVAGPDGNLWFTEHNPARIARITPGGTITEFPITASDERTFTLVTGKKGPLWFTDYGKVSAITTDGAITVYSFDNIRAIAADSDGNLYMAQYTTTFHPGTPGYVTEDGYVSKTTPDGNRTTIVNYPAIPRIIGALAFGPDGNIWHSSWTAPRPYYPPVTDYENGGYISKRTNSAPSPEIYTGAHVGNFVAGPDGNFWFWVPNGKTVGRASLSGTVSYYEFGADHSYRGFTAGPDQNLWFIDAVRNIVGKVVLDAPSANSIAIVRSTNYYGGSQSPDSIASIFGNDLANTTQSASSLPLPESLGGTSVRIKDSNGVEHAAPLFYVSPTQINFQVPVGLANGNAIITVRSGDGQAISTGETVIANTAPGLFSADGTGTGLAAALVFRVRADGSTVYEPVARLDADNKIVTVPIDLGPEGDQVALAMFGTGLRGYQSLCGDGLANCQIKARIGVDEVPVLYIGSQGQFASLDQINISLPRNISYTTRSLPARINLTINGKSLNTVHVVFKL